ncbi:MAG: DUF547 domain-containing protein [Acidobacteria bacterium]|nr:DUF547 domain-containing protein [Acidobacteriota bacterium]
MTRAGVLAMLFCVLAAAPGRAQSIENARKGYDAILDLYVRDGLVYYRALKSDRSRLDAFVGALAEARIENAPRDQQVAFWINAYNAIVLQAIVDRYPIAGRSADYPGHSVRQIPGVFERATHRIAGRTLTLDQIERDVLAGFHDPRVFFALGRGAAGSGRLRSEAFTADRLETQLADARAECVTRNECVRISLVDNSVGVSAIFSWREQEFAAAFRESAAPVFAQRSPIERAILGFIAPTLLSGEREFLQKNQFRIAYLPFDWSLNDLTGRGGQ